MGNSISQELQLPAKIVPGPVSFVQRTIVPAKIAALGDLWGFSSWESPGLWAIKTHLEMQHPLTLYAFTGSCNPELLLIGHLESPSQVFLNINYTKGNVYDFHFVSFQVEKKIN